MKVTLKMYSTERKTHLPSSMDFEANNSTTYVWSLHALWERHTTLTDVACEWMRHWLGLYQGTDVIQRHTGSCSYGSVGRWHLLQSHFPNSNHAFRLMWPNMGLGSLTKSSFSQMYWNLPSERIKVIQWGILNTQIIFKMIPYVNMVFLRT
jgi:hypothetical protein